jgi:hypothetical protein
VRLCVCPCLFLLLFGGSCDLHVRSLAYRCTKTTTGSATRLT